MNRVGLSSLFVSMLVMTIVACGEPEPTPTSDAASPDVPAASAFAHISPQPPGGKWLAPAKNRQNLVKEFRKSGTLYLVGVTLSRLSAVAYGVHPRDIVLGDSVESSDFDAVVHPRDGSVETARHMLRDLIRTQLGLEARPQRKQAMVMILGPHPAGTPLQPSASRRGLLELGKGELRATGSTMSQLVDLLREDSKIPVIDETGLAEHYDYLLEWDPKKGAYAFIQSLGDVGLALSPALRHVESLLMIRAEHAEPEGKEKLGDGG
ncbi:MAG: TIGR03435 family protein [Myxococcales bacterium]|nr:TIGR03435 family protein [Myxococcales bacterium]